MGGCLATARTRGTVILLLTLLAGMAWAQSSLSPELARMLGGIDITEATREHARQMLQSAAPPTG